MLKMYSVSVDYSISPRKPEDSSLTATSKSKAGNL